MSGIEKLEKAIQHVIGLGSKDREDALEYIANTTTKFGMWGFAECVGILDEDRSCEEFGIAFMTAYNKEIGYRY